VAVVVQVGLMANELEAEAEAVFSPILVALLLL
jgi:hypothetical protein